MLHEQDVSSAGEIADSFPAMSRPAVSRHLRVLREAGLVSANGIGRQQQYRLNRAALARLQRDWFARFTPLRDAALDALRTEVESREQASEQRSPRRRRRLAAGARGA
jgi:DNA-binding transcriptional ArsR family regulator